MALCIKITFKPILRIFVMKQWRLFFCFRVICVKAFRIQICECNCLICIWIVWHFSFRYPDWSMEFVIFLSFVIWIVCCIIWNLFWITNFTCVIERISENSECLKYLVIICCYFFDFSLVILNLCLCKALLSISIYEFYQFLIYICKFTILNPLSRHFDCLTCLCVPDIIDLVTIRIGYPHVVFAIIRCS